MLEDHARFVLDHGPAVESLKSLRHDLVRVLAAIPYTERLTARDTPGDVGVEITAAGEFQRADIASIVTANWKRVQQAVRALEEFAKPLDADAAAGLEQIRYRLYALESRFHVGGRQARLAAAALYVLADGGRNAADFAARIERLVELGVDVLQLRDKNLSDRELLDRARCLRELTRGRTTVFIMNDRADLAVAADADGVHVGQDELPVAAVRRIVGSGCLIGVSTHTVEQVAQAQADGADYLGCGPTFCSETKNFAAFSGLEFLAAARAAAQLPAFAIGGIRPENVAQVVAAGFRRIAVSYAIWHADDPAEVVGRFRELLPRE